MTRFVGDLTGEGEVRVGLVLIVVFAATSEVLRRPSEIWICPLVKIGSPSI